MRRVRREIDPWRESFTPSRSRYKVGKESCVVALLNSRRKVCKISGESTNVISGIPDVWDAIFEFGVVEWAGVIQES